RGYAHARRGHAVALEHAFDGARVGQWADTEGLEFGQDGAGADQAVAGGRGGMGLEPTANRQDRLLHLGRHPLNDMAGPGQVVQACGTELQIAAPPLVKPSCGTAHGLADERHGPTSQAERDGTLPCRELVVWEPPWSGRWRLPTEIRVFA